MKNPKFNVVIACAAALSISVFIVLHSCQIGAADKNVYEDSFLGSVSVALPSITNAEAALISGSSMPLLGVIPTLEYEWAITGNGETLHGITADRNLEIGNLALGNWHISIISLFNKHPIGAGAADFVVLPGKAANVAISLINENDNTPPGKVTNLFSTNGNTSIDLFWQNPQDYDLYQIEIIYVERGSHTLRVVRRDSVTIPNLMNEEDIAITVKTVDIWGNISEGVQLETPAHTSAPPYNVSLLRAETLIQKITLNWTDPPDSDFAFGMPAGYIELEVSPAIANIDRNIIVPRGMRTYTFDPVAYNVTYRFTLKSVDKWGVKSSGTMVSAQCTPPQNVEKLKAIAGDTVVDLQWKDPASNVDHFEISFTPEAEGISQPITIQPTGGNNSFQITNLTNLVNYSFIVKTFDINGNSSRGISVTAQPADWSE